LTGVGLREGKGSSDGAGFPVLHAAHGSRVRLLQRMVPLFERKRGCGLPVVQRLQRVPWRGQEIVGPTHKEVAVKYLGPAGEGEAARRRLIPGNAIFFPAAAAYAVFVMLASLPGMIGAGMLLPGLTVPTGHAHEMLFGFALAVVAGNQLRPMPVARLGLLVALWALARVTFLLAPQTSASATANIAFALMLGADIAPRLLSAAKRLSNRALPLVLMAICASSVALEFASSVRSASGERTLPIVTVVLFAMLMLFMGGRIIGSSVAGQFQRQGRRIEARVQPRIESALLLTMTVAAGASAWPGSTLGMVAAAAMTIAGLLTVVRLIRWRLWALRGRSDLLCLATGYGWLGLGLLLYGAALATDLDEVPALHVITVGSLGTLTLNVMAMTWALRARVDPAHRSMVWATILVGAATLARVLASFGMDHRATWLVLASFCWSAAFTLLLVRFARLERRRDARRIVGGSQPSS
jgi:uncharacterized protein involved in response to NO